MPATNKIFIKLFFLSFGLLPLILSGWFSILFLLLFKIPAISFSNNLSPSLSTTSLAKLISKFLIILYSFKADFLSPIAR
jgi:hypothetical protein